jgi:mono/diheme cytochrome c family protein
MAETLHLSTSRMTEDDLKAIATYLKDQPGQNEAASAAPPQATVNSGTQIYADECSGCHGSNGKGSLGIFPALNGSAQVQQTDPTSLVHTVLRGARSAGTDKAPTAAAMPAFSWVLDDAEVAAVLTYIRNV